MKKFLLLLLLSLALSGCGEKSKVSDRAEAFMQEMFSGDINKAIDMMVIPKDVPEAKRAEFRQAANLLFQNLQQQFKANGISLKFKVGEVKFENADETAAWVDFEVTFAKGSDTRIKKTRLHLIKDNGQWLIDKPGHLE